MSDPPRARSRSASPPRLPRRRDNERRDSYRGGDSYRGERYDGARDRDTRRNRDREHDWDREEKRNDLGGRDQDRDDGRDRDTNRPREPRSRGGFKWKEKRATNGDGDGADDDRRPDRGYRNRSPRRDRGRDEDRPSGSTPQAASSKPDAADDTSGGKKEKRDKDKKDKKASAAPASGGEPFIVIHVNDRMGTKAAVPCLPSDTIRELKMLVAAQIGRNPHEILLKRQGERPFKDHITVGDYGISNGVQLDLEVDTGD